MERQPALADIAQLAQTSASTVSRVLSGRAGVSAATEARVRKVLHETGFVLNQRRSAAMRHRFKPRVLKHGAIAVLHSESPARASAASEHAQSSVHGMVLDGILCAADEAGIRVLICRVVGEKLDKGEIPASLQGVSVDGILSQVSLSVNYQVLERVAPLVFFGNHPTPFSTVPSVEPDNATAVAGIVRHLFDLGHRRYAFVSHDIEGQRIHQSFLQRRDALLACAGRLGCAAEVFAIPRGVEIGDIASGYAARPVAERPTALVCSNDSLAGSLLSQLIAGGVRVPDDVSVTGFDGLANMPGLTTWSPDWRLVGKKSFEVLLARARGEAVPVRTLVGGELRVRGSTASACDGKQ